MRMRCGCAEEVQPGPHSRDPLSTLNMTLGRRPPSTAQPSPVVMSLYPLGLNTRSGEQNCVSVAVAIGLAGGVASGVASDSVANGVTHGVATSDVHGGTRPADGVAVAVAVRLADGVADGVAGDRVADGVANGVATGDVHGQTREHD